jgi:response regulator of citrate/malate metabolism
MAAGRREVRQRGRAVIAVLIVDDDFRVAQVHADFVSRMPQMRVVGQAHTASAALDAAARQRPDLVLLDIYLPDASGLDVLRRLRRQGDHHPDVLLLTAARDMRSVRAAMRAGALHYLIKPVDFGTLHERLTTYAELHALRAREGDTDQREVDRLFALMRRAGGAGAALPHGRSGPTAERIVDALRDADEALSAVDVAGRVGISRATAQRYLSALARSEDVRLELRYGTAGRPEHRYRLES